MSSVTEYDAANFIKSIGVKLVKPVPIAATKPEPPAKPQTHIETKPVDREAEFAKRFDAELDAQIEFERHPDLFDSSDAGMENVQLVLDWLVAQGLPASRASVAEGIRALKGELLLLYKPEPVKAPPTTSAKPAPAKPVAPIPPPDPEAGLPPLPPYVVRVLGNNKLRTRKDVHAVPTSLYSQLLKGPFAEAFRNRVNAALAR